jgi:hypothetical protein
VFDSFVLEAMSPSNALNSVNKENVLIFKHKVVHKAKRISDLLRAHLTRQRPGVVDSDGMVRSDSKA